MIIARAPMRITFVGGGTDLKEFFSKEHGAVINAAINKYVYITVNRKFDPGIRIKYSRTENVLSVDDIEHPLFREALKYTGITNHVEITSHADIPTKGSGLGSSSSFLVCLLHALYGFKGQFKSPESLARSAIEIEREILKEHGGLQDQYIAAYGGIRYMEFHEPNNVLVSPVFMQPETRKNLENHLMMFYTGITRDGTAVQKETKGNVGINVDNLRRIKWQALQLRDELHQNNHGAVGIAMDTYWNMKRQLSDKISSTDIDTYYAKAKLAGAVGGKIMGAGGGGFFLFYVPPGKQDAVRKAMEPLREVPFEFEREGSKIIHVAENFLPVGDTDA